MNNIRKNRNLMISIFGILSLIITLGNTPRKPSTQTITPDISVTIVADKDKIKEGQDITYTITATNLGTEPAFFVDVAHYLPSELDFISLICDRGISPDTPFCEYSYLNPGESVTSVLVARPKQNISNHLRHITTTVSILFETADTVDSNSSNNSNSATTKLIGMLKKH